MIQEEFNLDISGALDSLDTLGANLDSLTQQFSVNLADALQGFDSIQVAPDLTGFTEDLQNAAATADPVVTPTADISVAQGEIEQLSLFDLPPIPVEADTTQAQAEITNLGTAASESAGGSDSGLNGLTNATKGFDAAAGVAAGSAGGLAESIGGINPATGAAVAGIATIAGTTKTFFDAAVEAESASQRFNNAAGTMADAIQHVQVGNLNIDLDALTAELGSTKAGVDDAVASILQLGNASGHTHTQVAQTADDIVALTARAIALNPQLGSLGDNIGSVEKALTRGGRFAQQYNINLSSTAIAAEAVAVAHQRGSDQVTFFDKVIAGSNLAVAQYGQSLQQDIGQGLQNPIIQLNQLKATMEETIVTFGTPLVAPVLELLKGALPIVQGAAGFFGTLDRVLIPIGVDIVNALSPLVTIITNQVDPALASLAPAAENFGKGFEDATKQLQPFVQNLAILSSAGAPVVSMLLNLGAASEQTSGKLSGLTIALGAFNPALKLAADLGGIFNEVQKKNADSAADQAREQSAAADKAKTLADAIEKATIAQVEQAAANNKLTRSQADAIEGNVKQAAATGDVTQTANAARDAVGQLATANSEAASSQLNNANAWLALADAVAHGQVATQDFASIATQFGVSTDDISKFVTTVTDGMQKLVDAATSKLPAASDALKNIGDSADPKKLETNLFAMTVAIQKFPQQVQSLLASGNTALANFLIQQGPQIGSAYATAVEKGGPKLAAALNNQLVQFQNATGDITAFYQDTAIPQIAGADGVIAQLGQQGTQALGLNLNFGGVAAKTSGEAVNAINRASPAITAEANRAGGAAGTGFGEQLGLGPKTGAQVQQAQLALAAPGLIEQATLEGQAVGVAYDIGLIQGMTELKSGVTAVAGALGTAMADATRAAIHANSPSLVAQQIGQDYTAGLILGLNPNAVNAAGSALAHSLVAGTKSGLSTPGAAVGTSGTNSGGISVQVVFESGSIPAGMSQSQVSDLANTTADRTAARVAAVVRAST